MTAPGLLALVLAAGRGERLRPLTLTLPKPLLPVAGRPLAAWTLERLRSVGASTSAINLHHLGAQIRSTFGERFDGMPLVYSDESAELLGTGGALPPLRDFLGAAATILLVNGDSLCRWPLRELLARHRQSGARATLLVHRHAPLARFGGGVAVERGRLVAFGRGPLAWEAARTRRVFAGAAALAPELLERLPPGPSDIVEALYEPMLALGETIAVVETSRPWFDLGTPERYLEAGLAWGLSGLPERGARVAAGAEIDPTARLRRVVVEARAKVGAGARLADCLILPDAELGEGVRLRRAIVAPGVALAAGTVLERALVTRAPDGDGLVTTPLAGS